MCRTENKRLRHYELEEDTYVSPAERGRRTLINRRTNYRRACRPSATRPADKSEAQVTARGQARSREGGRNGEGIMGLEKEGPGRFGGNGDEKAIKKLLDKSIKKIRYIYFTERTR